MKQSQKRLHVAPQKSLQSRFVPSRNGYFINNIIVFNQSDIRTYINVGSGTAPDTFIFGSNLWYALDNLNFSGPNLGSVPAETDSIIQQDPLLSNMGNGDYHIMNNSPAIGQGRIVPRGADYDFDGRLYGTPTDIGAYASP